MSRDEASIAEKNQVGVHTQRDRKLKKGDKSHAHGGRSQGIRKGGDQAAHAS